MEEIKGVLILPLHSRAVPQMMAHWLNYQLQVCVKRVRLPLAGAIIVLVEGG